MSKVRWKGKDYPEHELSSRESRELERLVGQAMDEWSRMTQVTVTVFTSVRAGGVGVSWDEVDTMPLTELLECIPDKEEGRKVPLDRQPKKTARPRSSSRAGRAAAAGSSTSG